MGNQQNKILTFTTLIMLAACGGGGGGGGGGSSAGGGYGTTPTNTAPTIDNSTNDYSTIEGTTSGFMVNASDADGNSLTYSVSGNDGSKMSVSTSGVVSFVSAPDFDTPGDANGDNIYSFNVNVSDGTLSITEGFTITVTNDTSDDEVSIAWDGVIISNDTYKPYDRHLTSYGLIIAALQDVSNSFLTNVGNIANKMLIKNDSTNTINRNLLLNNFIQFKAFQRVGSTNMSSYDPALNEESYPGWDNINDNYAVVDFIWEATSDSPSDEQTKAGQINAILEHLLHTITLIFDKSFNSWGYEDASSELVLAMNEAITGNYYDPTGNYGNLSDTNPTLYKRIIAQEFAYWMILTGWDLKTLYAPDVAPEWTILTASEMETKLPLAHKLFTDTVNGVLVNPTQAYLDGLTFGSLPSVSNAVSIAVTVAANNAGSGNVYVIEGTQKKSLTMEVGKTYTFNHPSGHPLRFSTTSNGTHAGGTAYTTGVNTSTDGVTIIEVTGDTPTTLYYYCSIHSGMGSSITVSS